MSGIGRVYRRGQIYWVAYYRHGHEYRESAHTTSEAEARRFLRKKIGRDSVPREERVTFEHLMELVVNDYEASGKRTLYDLKVSRVPHLKAYFGGDRALDITAGRLRSYILHRRREGAADSTINREMGVLRRGFRLAQQDDMLSWAPHISLLRETHVRQGFVTWAQYAAITGHLAVELQDIALFLYLTGWRVSEALTLQWRDVDVDAATITLREEHSKTGHRRTLPIGERLSAIVVRRAEVRRLDCPMVFHRWGKPIHRGVFSRSWRRAATAAGMAGIIVHDLRRSAARNMVRAGVPERVVMAMTGHRTRSMLDRYNIVSPGDLTDAQDRLSQYLDDARVEPAKVAKIRD